MGNHKKPKETIGNHQKIRENPRKPWETMGNAEGPYHGVGGGGPGNLRPATYMIMRARDTAFFFIQTVKLHSQVANDQHFIYSCSVWRKWEVWGGL